MKNLSFLADTIYLDDEDETGPSPKIWMSTIQPAHDAKITMLGVSDDLKWEKVGKGFEVEIPKTIQENPPCQHAWVLKISKISHE